MPTGTVHITKTVLDVYRPDFDGYQFVGKK
jgi:hypothetical protein